MTLTPKLLFALVPVLGAPLATPPVDGEAPLTDCSMPTSAPLAMTTVAPPTVSTAWDAPPTTLKASPTVPATASAQSLQTATAPPTVTSTSEAPPTQSPDPMVEEEPCEVDDYDVPLLT